MSMYKVAALGYPLSTVRYHTDPKTRQRIIDNVKRWVKNNPEKHKAYQRAYHQKKNVIV